jgi:predicted peptidase
MAMRNVCIVITLLLPSFLHAQQPLDARVDALPEQVAEKTNSFNPEYLVYFPERVEPGTKLSLVIYLHGAGGIGKDISKIKRQASPIVEFVNSNRKEPAIVVAPQCFKRADGIKACWQVNDLNIWLAHLKTRLPIDEKRIYLTGTSMGGYGTWMWCAANPEHFAAVAPLCGGLGEGGPKDITPDFDRWAKSLATVPLWAFHGGKDNVVPTDRSEKMVEAIEANGGTAIKLTIYPELGHGIAKETYLDAAFYDWLFSHSK